MNETKDVRPKGVSQFAIMYCLAKQARNLGAYKLARQVLEKMQSLRVPPRFQVRCENVIIHLIRIRVFVTQRHRQHDNMQDLYLEGAYLDLG